MRTVYPNAQITPALLSELTKYGNGKAIGLHSTALYIQYLSSLSPLVHKRKLYLKSNYEIESYLVQTT